MLPPDREVAFEEALELLREDIREKWDSQNVAVTGK